MTSVLFLGGTGTISSACVERAIESGHDVTVTTRGRSSRRPHPEARVLTTDVRRKGALSDITRARSYDVVVDVLSFTADDVEAMADAVEGRCGQYVFLSSATVYRRPPATLPVAESAPLGNTHWEYARRKIRAEAALRARMDAGLPATIVRPSHTYDARRPVGLGGWTDMARIRAGEPVLVHEDPTTLWTITHARDFALLFEPLLADERAIGGTFNVMGDEALSWVEIYRALAEALGVADVQLAPVSASIIADIDPVFGERVLGDHGCSMTFDTSAVRAIASQASTTTPFSEGARQLAEAHLALPEGQQRDPSVDARIEAVLAAVV